MLTCFPYHICYVVLTRYGLQNYLVTYQGGYATVEEEYINKTHMAINATWGTDFEMTVLAHLLNTVVFL